MRFSGSSLRARRITAGLRREDLAQAVNRSYSTVVLLEQGKVLPSVPTLVALSEALGCDISLLFSADDGDEQR